MRAEQLIGTALDETVGIELRKLSKRLRNARAGDPDGIHDARTELRRLREGLTVMGETVFDQAEAERLAVRLRLVEKALAEPRDADVMLDHLRSYVGEHRAEQRGLAELEALLTRRRTRFARRARRYIDQARGPIRATRRLVRRGQAHAQAPVTPKASPHLVEHFLHETIWRAYDAVLAYEKTSTTDFEALHSFRSACRRLRYTIELFEGALPGADVLVAELRSVQDEIGEMHDQHVATTRVEKWVRKGKLRPTPELDRFVESCRRTRDALVGRCVERHAHVLGRAFRASLVLALDPTLGPLQRLALRPPGRDRSLWRAAA